MKLLLSTILLAFVFVACGPNDSAEQSATESETQASADLAFYGAAFTPGTPVSSQELASQLEDNGGLEEVQVTGEVLAACQNKGCWMTLPLANGQEMRVRFKDYGFFVPKDCAGQTTIIQGKAYYDTTSVEDLRHYAIDGGMTEAEAKAKYSEPEIAISFEATGVALPKSEEAEAPEGTEG